MSGLEDNSTNLIGAMLDNYEIVTEVASGGMATIYHARQPALDRYVAVKILKAHLAQDAKKRERFVREAKVAAGLRHPNILTIHDAKWDPERDIASIIMEYVPGGTLKELMGEPMTVEQITPLLEQICAALDYAHKKGVIHRDIKPSNILLDKDNRVLIADFGLAAIIGGDTKLSSDGEVLGTPDYMAPEQVDGAPVDGRTDVYSLGIMIYEMLTGSLPYQAETPMGAMLKRMTESPPSPRTLRPDLSVEAEAVILKAIALAPTERFPDVQSFWQVLNTALQAQYTKIDSSKRKTRRMPLRAEDTLAKGRYKIVNPLGEGAYGVVYLAHDTRLERRVALKLLHNKIARNPSELKRFKREPIITAQIGNHPNIVGVYDFEVEDEGISYIIMEYVDGGSLREYLQEHKNLQTLEIARFGRDICQGLEAIHEHHIIHLDLKPGNIMLKTRQRHLTAKVSDFGNAVIYRSGSENNLDNPTPTGYARGTLLYTSPEQIAYQPGDDLDGRTDLYSLGAILYEMVAGRPPFDLEGTRPISQRINEDPPALPSTYNRFISKNLEEIILKALQKKREDRFSNAAEMLEALLHLEDKTRISVDKFELLFKDAKVTFEKGDFVTALSKFEALPLARNRTQHVEVEQYKQDCRKFIKLEADYQQAQQANARKEWANAVELLREVIRVDSDYRNGEAAKELDQTLLRLEASQEYHKGLMYIEQRDWVHADEQLNDTRTAFPQLTKQGDVLEEIADKIAYARRMLRLEDLLRQIEAQTQIARASMTPESWQQVVDTYRNIQRVAPEAEAYRHDLAEAEKQVNLAIFYRQGVVAMEAGNWAGAVNAFERIKQIERKYRETAEKLDEAEDQLKCKKLREAVDEDFSRQDWLAAKEKLERIISTLSNYQDAAPLLSELEIWLAALDDEKEGNWLDGAEKLTSLTRSPFVELKDGKIDDLKRENKLAADYLAGVEANEADNWREALRCFKRVEAVNSNYRDMPAFLRQLHRRAWLSKTAGWMARYPRWALGLGVGLLLLVALVSILLYRFFLPTPSSPPRLQTIEIWVDGVKIDPEQAQPIENDQAAKVEAKGFDEVGNPIVSDELLCWWHSPADNQPEWGECVFDYSAPTNSTSSQQFILVDMIQKSSNQPAVSIPFNISAK